MGYLPFQGQNIGLLYQSITNDEPIFDLPFIDNDFEELIKAMLVKNFQNRAKICEIKVHAYYIYNIDG